MKKRESLFTSAFIISAIVAVGAMFWYNSKLSSGNQVSSFPTTNYGAFLAAQHAIAVNDFVAAEDFVNKIDGADYATVQNVRYLSEFLNGKMPRDIRLLKDEKATAAQLIYDAYLIQNKDWQALYNRHRGDESALVAPLRIWSGIGINYITKTMQFIDSLPTNDSWKSFVKGQIYAEKNNIEKASVAFALVDVNFMNINDYLYIMSFYLHHDMLAAADVLRQDFTSRPGGMFMLDYANIPDWSVYSGIENALAFSLVQNVSHTQVMMYSDLSILLLRLAQITGLEFGQDNDAIHYYLGQYFWNNSGDYQTHFDRIDKESPFYLFGLLRSAEKSGDMGALKSALADAPLFVPAVNKLIAHNIQKGDAKAALKVVNAALSDEDLNSAGRAFFLKSRAQIYYVFGDLDKAQADIYTASEALSLDAELLGLQAKIWAQQSREIENAYDYAMSLVRQNPSDIFAWDTLGRVVYAREGLAAALEVLERVGEISATNSSLFEFLGDLYVENKDFKNARDSYLRALDLSSDGLSVVPQLEKKIRKLK